MEAEQYVPTRQVIKRFWNTTILSNETKQRDALGSDRYFSTRRNSSNETRLQTLLEQNDTFQRDEIAFGTDGYVPTGRNSETFCGQTGTFQRDEILDAFGTERYVPTRRNSEMFWGQTGTFQRHEIVPTRRKISHFWSRRIRSNRTKQRDILWTKQYVPARRNSETF